MLIWMCALHCEAKPVIDFYRLKKLPGKNDFDIYQNEDIACIVSGMGAVSMTRAVNWGNKRYSRNHKLSWLNLGIAGHKTLAIGTTVLVSRASQTSNRHAISTMTGINHQFETLPVISITEQQTDYDEIALFDMEAYSFLQTARSFSSAELCQSIKVISDNRETAATRDKAKISSLIAQNMQSISEFALKLIKP